MFYLEVKFNNVFGFALYGSLSKDDGYEDATKM